MTVTIDIAIHHAGVGVGAGGVLNGQQLAGGDKGGIGNGLPAAVRHRDSGIRIDSLNLGDEGFHRRAQGEARKIGIQEAQLEPPNIIIGRRGIGIRLGIRVRLGIRIGIGLWIRLRLVFILLGGCGQLGHGGHILQNGDGEGQGRIGQAVFDIGLIGGPAAMIGIGDVGGVLVGIGILRGKVEALKIQGILAILYVIAEDKPRTAQQGLIAGVPALALGIEDAVVVGIAAAVGADVKEIIVLFPSLRG